MSRDGTQSIGSRLWQRIGAVPIGQVGGGIAFALATFGAWFAYQHQGRLIFLLFGLIGLGAFAVLIRYPVLGVATIGFLMVSNLSVFLPSFTTPLALMTLAAVILPRMLRGDFTYRMVPVIGWGLLWFAFNALSAIWAVNYDQFHVFSFLKVILYMLCVIWVVEKPRDLYIVIAAIGLGVIVSAGFTINSLLVMLSGGVEASAVAVDQVGGVRFTGTWDDPNIGAISLIPFMALSLAALRSRAPLWSQVIAIFAIALAVVTAALGQSRSAFLAISLVFIMMVLPDRRRWLFIAVGLILLFAVLAVVPLDFVGRLGGLLEGAENDASISERSHIGMGALQTGLDYFPLGAGAGTVRYFTADHAIFLWRALVSHNAYLDTFAELGLIGVGLFLLTHLSVLQRLRVPRWKIDPWNPAQNFAIAGVTVVAIILLMDLFNSYANYPLFWFALALVSTHEWVFAPEDQRVERLATPGG